MLYSKKYPNEFRRQIEAPAVGLPHIRLITIIDIAVLIAVIIGLRHGISVLITPLDFSNGSDAASEQAFWQVVKGLGISGVTACLGIFYMFMRLMFKLFSWLFGRKK